MRELLANKVSAKVDTSFGLGLGQLQGRDWHYRLGQSAVQ